MREQLIQIMNKEGVDSTERSINLEDLLSAEEVFLTNALRGITSVGSFRGISYARKQADAWQQKLQSSLI
jgi:branched-subunit amino acid aminotransferase/4-amino-4-deoxychorismate lyase